MLNDKLKCRSRHKYAWRKRFNKLVKFITRKPPADVDEGMNESSPNESKNNQDVNQVVKLPTISSLESLDDYTEYEF